MYSVCGCVGVYIYIYACMHDACVCLCVSVSLFVLGFKEVHQPASINFAESDMSPAHPSISLVCPERASPSLPSAA